MENSLNVTFNALFWFLWREHPVLDPKLLFKVDLASHGWFLSIQSFLFLVFQLICSTCQTSQSICLVCLGATGCPSQGPCPDPYRREAIPVSHLRHPLPPPADPKEPPAHSHWREALHCESHTHISCLTSKKKKKTFMKLSLLMFYHCPVMTNVLIPCFPVWEVWSTFPPQEPAASSPASETRGCHQHQDPLQSPDWALPTYSAGLLKTPIF